MVQSVDGAQNADNDGRLSLCCLHCSSACAKCSLKVAKSAFELLGIGGKSNGNGGWGVRGLVKGPITDFF
jgi:hypothetical protein